METCYLLNLGIVEYHKGLQLQERLVELRRNGKIPDTLVLLEHAPVFTFGTQARKDSAKKGVVKIPFEELQQRAPVYDVSRGGSVTYHGPGQLVGYPILDYPNLRSKNWQLRVPFLGRFNYINGLEDAMIQTAKHYNVNSVRKPPDGVTPGKSLRHVGTWYFDGEWHKLGATGVQIRSFPERYITMHGFALNVNTDLSYFDLIYSCGLTDKKDTSLAKILGAELSMDEVRRVAATKFAEVFGYELEEVELKDLLP